MTAPLADPLAAEPPTTADVAVVGAGPAGLAAAARLKTLGVDRVIVIDREPPGGVPRHCGHSPYGLREYRRLLSGPAYAARLVDDARRSGVTLRRASVVRLDPGGTLTLSSDDAGVEILRARRVVLATGARETPRAARLVGGRRPLGVLTTGALQTLVYLYRRVPFRRPVVVGTELVSFSALLTCRHAGIRPVAMIESGARPTAWNLAPLLPRLLGASLYYRSDVVAIRGGERVEAVEIASGGTTRTLDCDGVIFSGRFIPETALLADGPIGVDPASGGPVVDQFGRCTDPAYFAAGNLLRPVETAGWCWREGGVTAEWVAASLTGRLPPARPWIDVEHAGDAIRYALPQRLALPLDGGMTHLQLRFGRAARGRLALRAGDRTLWLRQLRALPERRVLVPLAGLSGLTDAPLRVEFDE